MHEYPLFHQRSTDVDSRTFPVAPGTVALITLFGLPEGHLVSISRVLTSVGLPMNGTACAGPDEPDLGSILAVEPVVTCCPWVMSSKTSLSYITVPGVYRITLDDPALLGTVQASVKILTNEEAGAMPASIVQGSGSCCDEKNAEVDCQQLQSLFLPGVAARLYGVDVNGQCVQSAVPTFTETPLTVNDSPTVDLTNGGTAGHTVTATVKVSGDNGNQIFVRPDGLYVPPYTETPFVANDSATIDFTTSGNLSHTMTGNVRISGDAGNQVVVRGDGLYVPLPPAPSQTPITTVDSATIAFSSYGTANHTITALTKVSQAAGNKLLVNQDGLFVGPLTCQELGGVFSAGVPTTIYGRDASGNCVVGALPQAPAGTETPLSAQDTMTTHITLSGTAGHTIKVDVSVSPDSGNRLVIRNNGLYVPPITCADITGQFSAGTPVTVLGVDANGNCVRGSVPSTGGGATVDCTTVRAAFSAPLTKGPSTKLLATNGSACGVVDACAMFPRALLDAQSPSLSKTFTLPELQALCTGGSGGTTTPAAPEVRDVGAMTLNSLTRTQPGGSAPSGTAIYRLTETAVTDYHYLTGISVLNKVGSPYKVEVELKLDPGNTHSVNQIRLAMNYGTANIVATFSTSDGSLISSSSGVSASSMPLANGFVKLIAQFPANDKTTQSYTVEMSSSGSGSYAGSTSRYLDIGQFSLSDMSGVANASDDPILFSQMTSGWKGNSDFYGAGSNFWPAVTSTWPIVSGRVYLVTSVGPYPKAGVGPFAGNLSCTPSFTGGGAATLIDDPMSVPIKGGEGWMNVYIYRATADGTMGLTFDTTADSVEKTKHNINWIVSEVRTTSGQPATYSESVQSGTLYSLNSASPNNVMQNAKIPGVLQPYELFVFGSMKTDNPSAGAGKGFAFSGGTLIGAQYSSAPTSGGGSEVVADINAMDKNNITLSAPGGNAPSGTPITRVTETAVTGSHYLGGWRIPAGTASGIGQQYTVNIELRTGVAGSRSRVYVYAAMGSGNNAYFSLTDGSRTSASSGVTTTTTDLGGGWKLLSITFPANDNNPQYFAFNAVDATGDNYAGDTSKYIDVGKMSYSVVGAASSVNNVATAHVSSAANQVGYGVYSNDPAWVTGAVAPDDYRVAYKGFRFHAEVSGGSTGTPQSSTFHQTNSTLCDTDTCAVYRPTARVSGSQIIGTLPENSAYRLVWRVNGVDKARVLLDNRGGTTPKPIELMGPAFDVLMNQLADGACSSVAVEIRAECVQNNPAATIGTLTVDPYQLVHTALPVA